jgi:hypothetical protein
MANPDKAFAASIGMRSQHPLVAKSCELRKHYFNESLGAIKLACLWVLELHGKTKTTSTASLDRSDFVAYFSPFLLHSPQA